MIKRILFLLAFMSLFGFSKTITYQVIVFDDATQAPLQTTQSIPITSSFIDGGNNEYFRSTQDQHIADGLVNVNIVLDVDQLNDVLVFDQPNLRIKLELLDDIIFLPISSVSLAVLSKLTDKTLQLMDDELFYVDYLNRQIRIGGLVQLLQI